MDIIPLVPISLELNEQEHVDGNDTVSEDNNNFNDPRKIYTCYSKGLWQFPIHKYKQEHE